ncbi:MAG: endopeptidase La [Treponema sp.]|nr:endopeptidase La [Treponema sp.]
MTDETKNEIEDIIQSQSSAEDTGTPVEGEAQAGFEPSAESQAPEAKKAPEEPVAKDAPADAAPKKKRGRKSKAQKEAEAAEAAAREKSDEAGASSGEQNEIHIRISDGSGGSIMPIDQMLPNKLFIVPIQGRPMFPGIFTPLMISAGEDTKVVERAYDGDGFVGIIMTRKDEDEPNINDLYEVGTVARIIRKINLPDGGVNIFVSTLKRFKIRKVLRATSPMAVAVEYLDDFEDDTFEVKALTRALISEMKEVSENNPMFSEEMRLNMVNIDHPGKIADFIASILNVEKEDQQKVLEQMNVRARMEQVLVFIKKEQELLRIQKKVQNELNERVEKNQREYFLREEMKSIQEELGTQAGGGSDYQKLKEKIEAFGFTGEIKEATESELEKFHLMDPTSSEYFMTRSYLELVCDLPWKESEPENYDLAKAYKVLEGDHYGLDDVKKRIMEYLAVRKLKADSKGSILILVGPPGVGKTSVGHSIANAMNKPFYRFSVGGMRDEAEIKGHRRTYIGSMPGKILQGLKITKTKSPVFMIDEVDKMGASYSGGDPASALLEVLDPEQNISFRDNYLDLPFDVSDVFFILTANTLDSIPEPLLDRAEIIHLSGYIDQEKLEIAKKYLIPKNLAKNGLAKKQVSYTKAALQRIAEEYAREAGVRNYEKCLDKIHRKLVTEALTGIPADAKKSMNVTKPGDAEDVKSLKAESFTIDAPDLEKYLGKPVFDESEIKKASIPGTAIGLAWTSMGGDTLLIESVAFPSDKGGLQLTGQLGDVMKESAQIAMNWVRQYAVEHKIKPSEWFERNTIHLHIPEGATPKDGPSAGITMATTFMSLIIGRTIKPHLAMTGELALTGKVMPIGGLREKTVAAKRNGIKTILIPKGNVRDLEEIPEHVKTGITFIPVGDVMEVMKAVFPPEKAKTSDGYGF